MINLNDKLGPFSTVRSNRERGHTSGADVRPTDLHAAVD